MPKVRIIGVWQTLFRYASNEGKARLAYKDWPSSDNKARLDAAIKAHEDYKQLCLDADEMIGLDPEAISGALRSR